jgi:sugar phosphate isomerase/epimerase
MTYFASSCFKFRNTSDLFKFCRQAGYYELELGGNLKFEPPTETQLARAQDFSFLIHNYFPAPAEPFILNLASADTGVRQKSLTHAQNALKLCQTLDIPSYSVHAGFLVDLKPDNLGKKQSDLPFIDRQTGLKIFTESIAELLNDTVDLLIENNVNSRENLVEGRNKLYLLAEPEETLKFFQSLNNPRLGLLVDLGHLNVSAKQLRFNKYEYLEILAPWIKAFHLSANDGISDQGLPFNQNEWFIEALKKFPDAAKIIEISNKSRAADLVNCLKIIDCL